MIEMMKIPITMKQYKRLVSARLHGDPVNLNGFEIVPDDFILMLLKKGITIDQIAAIPSVSRNENQKREN